MLNAVIYYRVSSDDQLKGHSLESQLDDCQKYCESNGYSVLETFREEGESAKTTNRKKLIELLDYCTKNKGKIQFVVIYKIDRFARNNEDYVFLRAQLAKLGITIKSASEPIQDTPEGRLMETLLSGFAQFDNEIRAQRTVKGVLKALEMGRWTGKAPLGYLKGMIIDPQRSPIVTRLFETYSRGGVTVKRLAELANEWGLNTQQNKPIIVQTMHKILCNQLYYGWMSRGGEIAPFEGSGNWTPLISKELFYQVQSALEQQGNRTNTRHRERSQYPLKKLIKCYVCKKDLTASPSPKLDRHGDRILYYHCKQGHVRVSTRVMNNKIIEMLQNIRLTEGQIRLNKRVQVDVFEQDLGVVNTKIKRLHSEIQKLRQQMDEARIMRENKEYSPEEFKLRKEQLTLSIHNKEIELSGLRKEEVDLDYYLSLCESLMMNASVWWQEAPLYGKQEIQRFVWPEGLILEDKSGKVTTPVYGIGITLLADSGVSFNYCSE